MAAEHHDRLFPCYILRGSNIPCVLWCEDALKYYGVPTELFSIYILVPDIDKAAMILTREDWHLEDSTRTEFGNVVLRSAHRCLTPPTYLSQNTLAAWSPDMCPPPLPSRLPSRSKPVVLLPASEWKFTFPSIVNESYFPSLPELLDALIDKLLDLDPQIDKIWDQVAVLVAYLYEYVPRLRIKSFAAHLKYEHRQYHYDSLSGMFSGTIPFLRHEREIRDALRKGSFQLCDCSADRGDEMLFNDGIQADLMALIPAPYTAEEYEVEKQRELDEERAWFALHD